MTTQRFFDQDSGALRTSEGMDALESSLVASNANHLANVSGQCLVNWAVADADGIVGTYPSDGAAGVRSAVLWRSGPLFLRLKPSGSIYPIRLRVRAFSPRTFTVELLGNRGSFGPRTGSRVNFVQNASPPSDWLTNGSIIGESPVIAPSEATSRRLVATTRILETGGEVSVPQAVGYLEVRTALNVGETATLTGFFAQQFYDG